MILMDDWSDLSEFQQPEPVDDDRLHAWRLSRLREKLLENDASDLQLLFPFHLLQKYPFQSLMAYHPYKHLVLKYF